MIPILYRLKHIFVVSFVAATIASCTQTPMPHDLIRDWVREQAPSQIPNPLSLGIEDFTGLNSPWTRHLLFVTEAIQVSPLPQNDPWYIVETGPAGDRLVRLIRDRRAQIEIESVSFSQTECWTENSIRYCSSNVRIISSIKNDYASLINLDLRSVTTNGRIVVRRDPRVGQWEISDHRIFPAIREALTDMVHEALRDVERNQLTQSRAHDVGALVDSARSQAFDTIEQTLQSTQRLTDYNTVVIRLSNLEFLRDTQYAPSFRGLQQACEQLSHNGFDDWRMPTEREFSAIFNDEYNPVDTPDQRFWSDTFAEDNRRRQGSLASGGIENSFFVNTFCEADGASCIEAGDLPENRIRISWFGSDPGPYYFPVTIGPSQGWISGAPIARIINTDRIFIRQPWSQHEINMDFPERIPGRVLCVRTAL